MIGIDLAGKVALITGASRGIGQAIATSLADAGATVIVNYHTQRNAAEEVARRCGGRSFALQGNVAVSGDCKMMVETSVERLGTLDILVNNAAVYRTDSFRMPYDDWMDVWDETMNTNLMSAVNTSYWAVQGMKKLGGGKIINIASRAAFRGETEHIAYAVSKAALVNFTRCLARTLAPDGIIAYAVAPGYIETDMAMEDIQNLGPELRAQIPSGRIGTPQDVADVVLFLASHLSDYITGTTIDVNGGSYLH